MVEFDIKIPDFSKYNLAALYMDARAKYLPDAMQKSLNVTVSEVQGRVPIGVTGSSRKSVFGEIKLRPGVTLGVVSSTMRRPNMGIFVINYGRKMGKPQPPAKDLIPWVEHRGLVKAGQSPIQAAFMIARSIKRKGTKPLQFMFSGLDAEKGQIEEFHREAVENIIEELNRGS
jgi:hypothetical protein